VQEVTEQGLAGSDHAVTGPVIVDGGTALPAFRATSGWRCG
jgi:hypothetical protein